MPGADWVLGVLLGAGRCHAQEVGLPRHIDCSWMGPRRQTQTSQIPLFSKREFKGKGHRSSQSYTLWVENLLSRVLGRRQEVEENRPGEKVPSHTHEVRQGVCSSSYENPSYLSHLEPGEGAAILAPPHLRLPISVCFFLLLLPANLFILQPKTHRSQSDWFSRFPSGL